MYAGSLYIEFIHDVQTIYRDDTQKCGTGYAGLDVYCVLRPFFIDILYHCQSQVYFYFN